MDWLSTLNSHYNGALAVDDVLLPGVKEAINKITDIDFHVITVSNPKRLIAPLRS